MQPVWLCQNHSHLEQQDLTCCCKPNGKSAQDCLLIQHSYVADLRVTAILTQNLRHLHRVRQGRLHTPSLIFWHPILSSQFCHNWLRQLCHHISVHVSTKITRMSPLLPPSTKCVKHLGTKTVGSTLHPSTNIEIGCIHPR